MSPVLSAESLHPQSIGCMMARPHPFAVYLCVYRSIFTKPPCAACNTDCASSAELFDTEEHCGMYVAICHSLSQ